MPLGSRRAKPAKFPPIKHHALISQYMLENHRTREKPDRQSVGRSAVVNVIGGDEISGTGHVLNDGAGISGNVFSDVARRYPGIGVETSAGRRADDNNESLSVVEFLAISRDAKERTDADRNSESKVANLET